MLYLAESPDWEEAGLTHIDKKAELYAFVLTYLNLANSSVSQKQSNGNVP